jgi:hypothetical protein
VDFSGRDLPVFEAANGYRAPDAPILLEPGQTARVEVWWSNWCQPEPDGPLALVVTLWEARGQLAVPVEGSAPGCTAPAYPSLLQTGPFQPWD